MGREAVTARSKSKQRVVAVSSMDSKAFMLHMNNRHADSLKGNPLFEQSFTVAVEESYRAFHRQLHRARIDIPHQHDPEPPEARIEYAMSCLLANRQWGWFQIAGYEGVVSPFPNGAFATRINGIVRHHKNAAEAAIRIMKGK